METIGLSRFKKFLSLNSAKIINAVCDDGARIILLESAMNLVFQAPSSCPYEGDGSIQKPFRLNNNVSTIFPRRTVLDLWFRFHEQGKYLLIQPPFFNTLPFLFEMTGNSIIPVILGNDGGIKKFPESATTLETV